MSFRSIRHWLEYHNLRLPVIRDGHHFFFARGRGFGSFSGAAICGLDVAQVVDLLAEVFELLGENSDLNTYMRWEAVRENEKISSKK